MRPRTLDEVVGQDEVVGPQGFLRAALAADRVPSLIFWGPPGSGKTTLARLIAESTAAPLRAVLRRHLGDQGDQGGDGRGGARPPDARPANPPLRRRDPPLQPRPAGRVPALRRARRHRAGRRDDREPVVRAQRGAALALPGGGARGARRGRSRGAAAARARRPRARSRLAAGSEPTTSRSGPIARSPTATRGARSTCSSSR